MSFFLTWYLEYLCRRLPLYREKDFSDLVDLGLNYLSSLESYREQNEVCIFVDKIVERGHPHMTGQENVDILNSAITTPLQCTARHMMMVRF